jgi:2-polyprenyl-6-hydroxyphenyl methylase/3-demethylubiquinone-9 3-methyltransferase
MDNIDENELAKFSLLANSWWDRNGPSKPLHDLNPCRGKFVAERATLNGARVLDVGCGGGILSEYLADAGASVTGIDASAELIDVARAHGELARKNITYECTTVEEFSRSNTHSFDVVTCMELVEHVPDPQGIVNACSQQLCADGHLFVSTINRTAKAYALAILAAEYALQILPKGTHDYEKFIKPSELARWSRAAGLSACEFAGIKYQPNLGTATLNHDISINYLAHFSFE